MCSGSCKSGDAGLISASNVGVDGGCSEWMGELLPVASGVGDSDTRSECFGELHVSLLESDDDKLLVLISCEEKDADGDLQLLLLGWERGEVDEYGFISDSSVIERSCFS